MNIISVKILCLWIFTAIFAVSTSFFLKYEKSSIKVLDKTSNFTISVITPPINLGEGPFWNVEFQKLYFVDIIGEKIHSFNPASGKIFSSSVAEGPISYIIGVDNHVHHFIIGNGKNMTLIKWNDDNNETAAIISTLATVDLDRSDTRFNDAKIDSVGRFWGGTMGIEKDSKVTSNRGSLYSIDKYLILKKKLSPVSISNGIAWNRESDVMYYIDSPTRKITAFQYDIYNGIISNPRDIFDFNIYNLTGVPDGMTIDKDDNLWVANYGGGLVLNIDPRQGKLLRRIQIPSKQVTSVAFGGRLLNILYVTTASTGLSLDEKRMMPYSGCVFAISDLGVCGLTPNKFKLY